MNSSDLPPPSVQGLSVVFTGGRGNRGPQPLRISSPVPRQSQNPIQAVWLQGVFGREAVEMDPQED